MLRKILLAFVCGAGLTAGSFGADQCRWVIAGNDDLFVLLKAYSDGVDDEVICIKPGKYRPVKIEDCGGYFGKNITIRGTGNKPEDVQVENIEVRCQSDRENNFTLRIENLSTGAVMLNLFAQVGSDKTSQKIFIDRVVATRGVYAVHEDAKHVKDFRAISVSITGSSLRGLRAEGLSSVSVRDSKLNSFIITKNNSVSLINNTGLGMFVLEDNDLVVMERNQQDYNELKNQNASKNDALWVIHDDYIGKNNIVYMRGNKFYQDIYLSRHGGPSYAYIENNLFINSGVSPRAGVAEIIGNYFWGKKPATKGSYGIEVSATCDLCIIKNNKFYNDFDLSGRSVAFGVPNIDGWKAGKKEIVFEGNEKITSEPVYEKVVKIEPMNLEEMEKRRKKIVAEHISRVTGGRVRFEETETGSTATATGTNTSAPAGQTEQQTRQVFQPDAETEKIVQQVQDYVNRKATEKVKEGLNRIFRW